MADTGSHRGYERSLGLAHGSVRRAIQSGPLVRALRPDGTLGLGVADQELRSNTMPSAHRLSTGAVRRIARSSAWRPARRVCPRLDPR